MAKLPKVTAPVARILVARRRDDEALQLCAQEIDLLLSQLLPLLSDPADWTANNASHRAVVCTDALGILELLEQWQLMWGEQRLPNDPSHMLSFVAVSGTKALAECLCAVSIDPPATATVSLSVELTVALGEDEAQWSAHYEAAFEAAMMALDSDWAVVEPPRWPGRTNRSRMLLDVGALTFVGKPRQLSSVESIRRQLGAMASSSPASQDHAIASALLPQVKQQERPDGSLLRIHQRDGGFAQTDMDFALRWLLSARRPGDVDPADSAIGDLPEPAVKPAAPAGPSPWMAAQPIQPLTSPAPAVYPATPFEQRTPRRQPATLPDEPKRELEPHPEMGGTAMGTLLSPLALQATPFQPESERTSALAAAAPSSSEDLEPRSELGGTQTASGPAETPATPFDRPELALTIEQYASLMAECAEYPTRTAALRVQYGIADIAAQSRLDAVFHARFARNAAEQGRFLGLVMRYREWHAEQRKRGR